MKTLYYAISLQFKIVSIFYPFQFKKRNKKIRKHDLHFCKFEGHMAFPGQTNNLIHFQVFKKFWIQPIDTTYISHYLIEKFLAKLLISLTKKNQSMILRRHSIKFKIPVELFDHGQEYFLFKVTSLFTYVHIIKTINFIVDGVQKKQ